MTDFNSRAREIIQRRKAAAEDKSDYYQSLADTDGSYRELSAKLRGLELDMARADFAADKPALKALAAEHKTALAKLHTLLHAMGIDPLWLTPQYFCKKCDDTGYCDGRLCGCLSAVSYRLFCELFNQDTDSFPSFADALVTGLNKKEFDLIGKFTQKFPDVKTRTLILSGKTGTGKTFLAQCAAKALIDRGFKVIFVTAFDLINILREYHYSFEKSAPALIADICSCDLLVLDDFGTEPMIKNITQEYLLNILSLRQGKKLCTVITSNMTADGVSARYDERIFARLTDLNLTGIIRFNDAINFRQKI